MNIGIVGAGIIGRLLALKLVQYGFAVQLFDKDTREGFNSCSMAAAGMLAPYAELETSHPLLARLGMLAIAQWPAIIKSLIQPVYFKQTGLLHLAHPQDWQELKKFKQYLISKIPTIELLEIQPHNLKELEPELTTTFSHALFSPQEACLSPPALLNAFATTLLEHKVIWHTETQVEKVTPNHIHTQEKTYTFDRVFDCRGLGAQRDIPSLRGVRGELLWLHAPEVNLQHTLRLLHPRYPIYIVPRPEHIYVVGASMIESEDISPISVQTTMELLSSAYSLHKGFAEARIIKALANCRPALPDHLPKIFYQQGLIRINGLYRNGYTLAPVLAEEACLILTKGPEAVRFPELLQIEQ